MPPLIRVVHDRFPAIARAFQADASKVVRRTANTIKADIQAQMMAPHNGRLYAYGSRQHQASAPGEAPAVDIGTLIASITVNGKPLQTYASVSTDREYAPHLEFGTIKMAARPAWLPAAERGGKFFKSRLQTLIRRLDKLP